MYFNYRKFYEKFHGTIPIDENNIPYEIHHIDGNHSNNDITNLQCLSIDDHYKVHVQHEDWSAAKLILLRKQSYINGEFDKEVMSYFSSINNRNRVNNGSHNFLTPQHAENNSRVQKLLVESGVHHFCTKQDERGKKSAAKKIFLWKTLDEEDFLALLASYKMEIVRPLRNGTVQKKINSMIIQAINSRYSNIFDKRRIFERLKEKTGYDVTYSW